jgi:dipeptide/tripeptide permease
MYTTAQSYVSILWGKILFKKDMHLSYNCVELAWIAHRRNEVIISSLAMSHIFDTQCSFNLSTWYMSAIESN